MNETKLEEGLLVKIKTKNGEIICEKFTACTMQGELCDTCINNTGTRNYYKPAEEELTRLQDKITRQGVDIDLLKAEREELLQKLQEETYD